ncbi:MAG: hypothetical protein JW812_01715 [Alphaproteobacteria bacterium]|nr:hypothetical protein [Alphaproteobacteria bacterium]MBN2779747.1 hypothetical protein [Alphaproteobacteria bacterium]
MLHRLSFLLRSLIWIAVIVFFVYYPGDVRIQWLDYDVHTSIFFLFLVLFFVDKVMALFAKINRFLFHDLSRDVAISRYKSEIKSLKKKSEKQMEKDQKESQELARLKKDVFAQKWQNRWERVKKLFRK